MTTDEHGFSADRSLAASIAEAAAGIAAAKITTATEITTATKIGSAVVCVTAAATPIGRVCESAT
jgi:hypothetical protein